MKHGLLFLFLLLSRVAFCQNGWMEENCVSEFNAGKLSIDDASLDARVEVYLREHIPNLAQQGVEAVKHFQKESPIGRHLTLFQTFYGISIYGSEIKVNLSRAGDVLSLFHKTANTVHWRRPKEFPKPDMTSIAAKIDGTIRGDVQQVLFVTENGYVQVFAFDVLRKNGRKLEAYVMDTAYHVIFTMEISRSLHVRDSLVPAYIHLPDPLTVAERAYGTPYVDNLDSAAPELSAARTSVLIKAGYSYDSVSGKDSFLLRSPYVQFVEFNSPYDSLPVEQKPGFIYTRAEPGFERVNIFYHLNGFQEYVQRLGVMNLSRTAIKTDARDTYDDNSSFLPDKDSSNWQLHFGLGGVDDAEDADVIVHEYSHSLSHSASPNTVQGFERSALEEGLCDYFACSYSKNISKYNWEQLYNWDGHNPFWGGRWCVTKKQYPRDLTSIYGAGELWAGTLMEIEEKVGRDTTNLLMLATLYSLASNMSMRQAAQLFYQTDSVLFNAKHRLAVLLPFINHGLVKAEWYNGVEEEKRNSTEVWESYFDAYGAVVVRFPHTSSGVARLLTLEGKEIMVQPFYCLESVTLIHSDLVPGLYLLQVSSDAGVVSKKLVKAR